MSADTPSTTTLLCDADGNLFPSEEPAFVASAVVTNAFLAGHGVDVRFDPEALRLQTTGKNFRTTIADLAVSYGIVVTREEREHWVTEEREAVTRHLSMTLRPDRRVIEPLTRLGEQTLLAAVSSSATARLAACFDDGPVCADPRGTPLQRGGFAGSSDQQAGSGHLSLRLRMP